jgi:DNA-binding IclR family transcriptional regulator
MGNENVVCCAVPILGFQNDVPLTVSLMVPREW